MLLASVGFALNGVIDRGGTAKSKETQRIITADYADYAENSKMRRRSKVQPPSSKALLRSSSPKSKVPSLARRPPAGSRIWQPADAIEILARRRGAVSKRHAAAGGDIGVESHEVDARQRGRALHNVTQAGVRRVSYPE